MKILVASSITPRRDGDGAQLQVAHLISQMRAEHEVRTVYVGDGHDGDIGVAIAVPPPATSGLRHTVERLLGVITGTPVLVRQLRSTDLAARVAAEVEEWEPDCVLVTNGPASFICEVLGGVPRVLSTIDSWSLNEVALAERESGLKRLYNNMVVRRVKAYDRRTLPLFTVITTVAEDDRSWMKGLAPDSDIRAISNGVDVDFFSPVVEAVESSPPSGAFHGVMSYPPNVLAAEFLAREIMPLVWRTHPDVRLVLVGRHPVERVTSLQSNRIVVTGAVEDIRPHLASASVCVYPLLTGTGVKNKVLEAAAMGRPIVATPSAIGDLDLPHGKAALVGDTAQTLSQHITSLLDCPRPDLGLAARERVTRHHSWQRAASLTAQACVDAAASWHHFQ